MTTMTSFQGPPSGQTFNQLESINFLLARSLHPISAHEYYNQNAPFHIKPETMAEPTSPTPLTSELTTLSLKASLCPSCKGHKYGFTAYFHNSKIFPEPPHELLPLVEKAYVLKNRLKSLLVTYIMRGLEVDRAQEAEKEASVWSQLVEDLLSEVVASVVGFQIDMNPVEEVRNWTRDMTRQIADSVAGRHKLEMPKGMLLSFLVEFRKLWEGVWKGYLLDRKKSSNPKSVQLWPIPGVV